MNVNVAGSQSAGLSDQLGWLVRRWWIVVLAAVLGTGLGFGYALVSPKAYDSTTPVQVLAPQGDGAKVDLDTEAQIVPTANVAKLAQTIMGTTEDITSLLSHVSVTVPANTAILRITYEDVTPAAAQLGSQSFAQAYLNYRNDIAQAALDAQKANLNDDIKKQQDLITQELSHVPVKGSTQAAQQQQNVNVYNNQILQDKGRLTPLNTIKINPGVILSPASKPSGPSKPNKPLFLVGGLVVGLMLGLSAALIIARLDSRIYTGADVPERPDVPVLMEIRPGRQRPSVADAASTLGREFSLLRNVLRFAAGSSRGGRPSTTDTLLICSAVPGPAAGFVASNLAAAFARSGERVAIVCTDPDSTLPGILGVSAGYGLGEVLAGEIDLADALHPSPVLADVTVLTSGQLDPRLELPVAAVSDLLQRIQHGTDRVLIAASAPSSAVDAQALSEIAAAVVLVVETRRSHVPQVEAALDQFSRVYAPVAGMVVVTDHWKGGESSLDKRASAGRVTRVAAAAPPRVENAPDSGDDTAAVSPPRQLRGWQSRTGDSTLVLPKIVDVEDPPTTGWPTASAMDSVSSDSGSESR